MPVLVVESQPKSTGSERHTHQCPKSRPVTEPVCGAGACSVSGCPCPAFQTSYGTELCGNCGHKYPDHW